ncbi:putative DNA-binding domain-containing protein [Roseateles sp.]|uniref:HvfC/BufC family peptide modification chaperone n=1 Tax=Roseateles sp. TaxID=1971397 RepID=UPI003BA7A7A2
MKAQQEALVAALMATGPAELAGLKALPGVQAPNADQSRDPGLARGLQAYRLNQQIMSAKVLGSVYGRVQQELGEASFRAMAWTFWCGAPPVQAELGQWGSGLAAFLDAQEGMDAWLSDLARLEWATHELAQAADHEPDAQSWQLLARRDPANLGWRFQPAMQVMRVDAQAWSLWQGQNESGLCESGLVSVCLWRQGWRVQSRPMLAAEMAFLQAMLAGLSLEDGLAQAGADFDFSLFLQDALRSGLLHSVHEMAFSQQGAPMHSMTGAHAMSDTL